MSFYRETPVSATRKRRLCAGCSRWIEVGSPALNCAGSEYGDFWFASYHNECRAAEIGFNNLHDYRAGNYWMPLGDADWEDWPWLMDQHPNVASRMGITRERYDEIANRPRYFAALTPQAPK